MIDNHNLTGLVNLCKISVSSEDTFISFVKKFIKENPKFCIFINIMRKKMNYNPNYDYIEMFNKFYKEKIK